MSGSVYGCMAIFSELTVQINLIDSNEIPRDTLFYFISFYYLFYFILSGLKLV